jgi:hypothetical protein
LSGASGNNRGTARNYALGGMKIVLITSSLSRQGLLAYKTRESKDIFISGVEWI